MKNNILEELKKEVLKNKGLTVNAELKNANLKNGFMVSLMGYEFTTYNIDEAIKKSVEYKDIIKNKNNCFIGFWIDEEDNNKIYVDISKNISSRRDAEKTAKKNMQKAIYNIKDNESIYLNYEITFYSVYKKVYDKDKNIIDEVFKNMYNTIKEIPQVFRQYKEYYSIYKDNININEL